MFTICVLVAFLSGPSGEGANDAIIRPEIAIEAASADQLAQMLVSHHDALTAVSLVYMSKSQDVKGEPQGQYWRRAIAVRESGMFKSDNSHGHHRLLWHHDPRRKTLVVTPSESTLLEHLNRSVVELDRNVNEAPDSVLMENIFEVLCWWPFADWAPPDFQGHAYSLRELMKEGAYRLLPEKESVRNIPCYVFSVSDVLTVWCDCNRPERILKCERYMPSSGALDARFEMLEYADLRDDIWLPRKFRIVRFDSHAHTEELRRKVVYDGTFEVSELRVNEDVFESDFRQEYAPGTVRVVRTLDGVEYQPVVDGQVDHFKSILDWCRLGSPRPVSARQNSSGDGLVVFGLSFLVGLGIVVALVKLPVIMCCWRREKFGER